MLVIEEAHRLLANVSQGGAGDNTARAQAVESFSNLLAEIRAYGQGIVVIDQVPTKLASDVIKNTNLKIAHRIVDEADRKVLGGSMSMRPARWRPSPASPEATRQCSVTTTTRRCSCAWMVRPTTPHLAAETGGGSSASTSPPCTGAASAQENHAAPECHAASELAERVSIRQGISRIAAGAMRAGSAAELSTPEIVQALRRDAPRIVASSCSSAASPPERPSRSPTTGEQLALAVQRDFGFAEALRRLLTDTLKARATARRQLRHRHAAAIPAGSTGPAPAGHRPIPQLQRDLHRRPGRALPVPASRGKHPATPRRDERLEGRTHPRRVSQWRPGDAGNVRHHDRIRDPGPT